MPAPATSIPTDDQVFVGGDRSKPNVAFLKDHFFRQGRLSEEHALHIIDAASTILRAEPNILTVDSPVTGACAIVFHRSL